MSDELIIQTPTVPLDHDLAVKHEKLLTALLKPTTAHVDLINDFLTTYPHKYISQRNAHAYVAELLGKYEKDFILRPIKQRVGYMAVYKYLADGGSAKAIAIGTSWYECVAQLVHREARRVQYTAMQKLHEQLFELTSVDQLKVVPHVLSYPELNTEVRYLLELIVAGHGLPAFEE